MGERVDAILHGAGGDDLAVEFGGSIDIVVVEIESGLCSRCACSCVSIPSVTQVSMPSSLTALTMSQIRSRSLSFGLRQAAAMQNRVAPASLARWAVATTSLIHQLRGFHPGVVMRALRTVAAILRAAAGLDAEQACGLDVIGIEIAAMDGLRLKKQIREREIIECLGFEPRPIVARARTETWVLSNETEAESMARFPCVSSCEIGL